MKKMITLKNILSENRMKFYLLSSLLLLPLLMSVINTDNVPQIGIVCIDQAEAAESGTDRQNNKNVCIAAADRQTSESKIVSSNEQASSENTETFQYSEEDQKKIDEYRNTMPIYSLILTGAAAVILAGVLLGDKIRKRKKKRFKF